MTDLPPGCQPQDCCGDPSAHLPARPAPATDRNTLRERIAEAVRRLHDTGAVYALDAGEPERIADAVLAVLPAPDQTAEVEWWQRKYNTEHARHVAVVSALVTDRAALLLWAADQIDAETRRLRADGVLEPDQYRPCRDTSAQLRRLAGEAQQDERCTRCRHPKRDHDGRADHREKYSPLVAGDPWCHACNAECDYTREAQQDPTQDGEATLPCNWARTRQPHTQHDWEPQPGMDPVNCPGHPAKLPPMDPVHILGIGADAAVARSGQPETDLVEHLARGLAGAAAVNRQRIAVPWDDLTAGQQDAYRQQARTILSPQTGQPATD